MVYTGGMRARREVYPVTSSLDAFFHAKNEILTVPEVAAMLNMTKPGLYKWIKEGVIPAYKVGSTWFILRDELKQTLEAGANSPRDHAADVALRGEEEEHTIEGE